MKTAFATSGILYLQEKIFPNGDGDVDEASKSSKSVPLNDYDKKGPFLCQKPDPSS